MPKPLNKEIRRPVLNIGIRVLVLFVVVSGILFYSDSKGYFNADLDQNHTYKKWNSFYDLTKKNFKVDVVLFGNSHLYTGINPKNLGLNLRVNTFVMAAPGTNIADTYFAMKEVFKVNKPKLAVIETYGINDFEQYALQGVSLSSQFKSFSARRDLNIKMQSTPYLYLPENYFNAWSSTLRNHEFLFNNHKQLKENKRIIDHGRKTDDLLYLGRFVRFLSGIEKDLLKRYEEQGAPVDGKNYAYGKDAEKYVSKIVALCKEEEVELIFLTLPMYEKHIEDYMVWKNKLGEILYRFPNKWLDMQIMPMYDGFAEFAFENTYANNQHMSYHGSLIATLKLADYIRDSLEVDFEDRSKQQVWHDTYYGDEGYFDYFDPVESGFNVEIIDTIRQLQNIGIKNCLTVSLIDNKSDKVLNKTLIIKIRKQHVRMINYKEFVMRAKVRYDYQGKIQTEVVEMKFDKFHLPKDEALYSLILKPEVKILELIDGALLNPNTK